MAYHPMLIPRLTGAYYRKGENRLDHKKCNKNDFCPEADHLLPGDIQVLNTIRRLLAGETMQRSEKSEMEHLQCMK